ncbi:MAG TPA: Gldg family protein [Acetobacteraceae bacterium]|nr:Gldg family protein [Acetobacteraceae bacterium]
MASTPSRRGGSRLLSSIIAVVAVAGILVGINMFADTRLANAQLDVTQQRLYTLSPGTRQILAGLKEPITLRLYYSRQLGTRVPAYGSYEDRVRDLLDQYARVSSGKLRIETFNPQPFSDTEDQAMAYGLQGVPVDNSGDQVYFGLAGTNLLDDERVVPFFQADREPFLEYDLSRLVYELSNPTRAVIGVVSSLPLDGDPRAMMMMRNQSAGGPWASMLLLRQTFTVKTVPLDTQMIDKDVQVLLVAQAQKLSDNALYAIDQFVMRGGRLMVMVDPQSEAEAMTPTQTGEPNTDTSSDLKKLFDAWGIEYDPKVIVGDLDGAWRVRGNSLDRVQAVDYVAWFNIRDGINHNDPATADLQQVTVASSGFISKKDGASIEMTPLLTSSKDSGTVPVDKVRVMPDPAKILAAFKPSGGPRVIAARVRGVLKSAFSGPPPLPTGQTRPAGFPDYIAETKAPANLVIAADSDILADRFWVRQSDFFGQQQATPFSDNGPFVANLLGSLAGGDALIGLRSHGTSLRPFVLVDNIQRQAEARFRQTQQALQAHLDDVQKKLADLRAGREPNATPVISVEQRDAIEGLRQDITDTRAKLRAVEFNLRSDISSLETELRLFNIVLVPAILTIVAIVLGIARQRQRARARA